MKLEIGTPVYVQMSISSPYKIYGVIHAFDGGVVEVKTPHGSTIRTGMVWVHPIVLDDDKKAYNEFVQSAKEVNTVVCTPPTDYSTISSNGTGRKIIFLAGSIEMGVAEDWQKRVISELSGYKCLLLNPRRPDWDSSWTQSIDNPNFYGQVDWEHTGLEDSDIIIMYFDPNTKSPITLLELGLFASSGKLIVCCPDGYWRKGNVDYICQKYNIKTAENLTKLIEMVQFSCEALQTPMD